MPRTKAEKIAAAKKRHGFAAVNKPRCGGPKKFESKLSANYWPRKAWDC